MTEQISKDKFPSNGGWKFRQPQFGAWTNPMAMVGFDASVKEIIKVRERNLAITRKHGLSTSYPVVSEELLKYNAMIRGIPIQGSPSFFQQSSSRLPARVVAAVADIKRAAQGTAVVLDWLQSGGPPVAQDLANKRAAVCVACPRNVPGHWYTEAPAEIIKASLEARKDLSLATPHDASLKSCDVCKCLMRLKVWTPLDFIVKNTRPEVLGEFPPHCWIAKRDT